MVKYNKTEIKFCIAKFQETKRKKMIAAEIQHVALPLLILAIWKNLVTQEKSLTFIKFTFLHASH